MNDKTLLLFIGFGVLLAVAGGTKVYTMTRGLRNNNPGNIRIGDNWQGMSDTQRDDEFVTFESPVWGFRALARVLKNYQARHGLDTVREIIYRWAPPNENDSESYVRSVAARTGFGPDEKLDLNDDVTLLSLAKAITHHENGMQPYSNETIMTGIRLA